MPFDFLKPKPRQTITGYPTDLLLGDLLIKAGLINQQQLDEAIKLAGNKHVHVGQMLVNFRYISPRDLQAAVDAQSALRDKTIDATLAARCLKIACKTGMSFGEVVQDQNAGSSDGLSNKLGELLFASGLINKEQFAKSMQRSLATGLPLGRILVLNGSLSEPLLTMALEIQVRIRDDMMTRDEAIESLSAAGGKTGLSQEETFRLTALPQPRRHGIRLGELFVLANLLAETDVMNALELGLVNDQPIGQVLVAQGYVSEELLSAALELQKRVDDNRTDTAGAAAALIEIKTTGMQVDQVLEQMDRKVEAAPKQALTFDKLLILARVVTPDDIDNAMEQAVRTSAILAKVLQMTGHVDEFTMTAVLQCYTMLSNGFLTQDDAAVALDYCLHREERTTFAEALSALNWNATLPMQLQGITSVDISQVKLGIFSNSEPTLTSSPTEYQQELPAEYESAMEEPAEEQGVEEPAEEQGVEEPAEEQAVEEAAEERVVEEAAEEQVVEEAAEEPVVEESEPTQEEVHAFSPLESGPDFLTPGIVEEYAHEHDLEHEHAHDHDHDLVPEQEHVFEDGQAPVVEPVAADSEVGAYRQTGDDLSALQDAQQNTGELRLKKKLGETHEIPASDKPSEKTAAKEEQKSFNWLPVPEAVPEPIKALEPAPELLGGFEHTPSGINDQSNKAVVPEMFEKSGLSRRLSQREFADEELEKPAEPEQPAVGGIASDALRAKKQDAEKPPVAPAVSEEPTRKHRDSEAELPSFLKAMLDREESAASKSAGGQEKETEEKEREKEPEKEVRKEVAASESFTTAASSPAPAAVPASEPDVSMNDLRDLFSEKGAMVSDKGTNGGGEDSSGVAAAKDKPAEQKPDAGKQVPLETSLEAVKEVVSPELNEKKETESVAAEKGKNGDESAAAETSVLPAAVGEEADEKNSLKMLLHGAAAVKGKTDVSREEPSVASGSGTPPVVARTGGADNNVSVSAGRPGQSEPEITRSQETEDENSTGLSDLDFLFMSTKPAKQPATEEAAKQPTKEEPAKQPATEEAAKQPTKEEPAKQPAKEEPAPKEEAKSETPAAPPAPAERLSARSLIEELAQSIETPAIGTKDQSAGQKQDQTPALESQARSVGERIEKEKDLEEVPGRGRNAFATGEIPVLADTLLESDTLTLSEEIVAGELQPSTREQESSQERWPLRELATAKTSAETTESSSETSKSETSSETEVSAKTETPSEAGASISPFWTQTLTDEKPSESDEEPIESTPSVDGAAAEVPAPKFTPVSIIIEQDNVESGKRAPSIADLAASMPSEKREVASEKSSSVEQLVANETSPEDQEIVSVKVPGAGEERPGSAVPAASATPAVPAASATPAVPTASATPAVPTASATPAVPAASATPAVPAASATPAVPAVSATPAVPPVSAAPAVPPASATPAVPPASATPAVPAASATPAVPPVSAAPAVPAASATPAVPPVSAAPAVPAASATPAVPAAAAPAPGQPAPGAIAPPPKLPSTIINQLDNEQKPTAASAPPQEAGAKTELKEALGDALVRLAESYYEQRDFVEAQKLYERILTMKQNQLGPKDPSLGADLTNLAGVLCVQGKFADAEPYVKRVVTIIEESVPLDPVRLADSLNTLAGVLFQQAKYTECEPLLERSLKLKQERLGMEHQEVADNLRDYAKLLRKLGRSADAELAYAQAKAIISKRPKPAASS